MREAMTKPAIDWTLPLRVVGTHERVQRVQIEPAPTGTHIVAFWQARGGQDGFNSTYANVDARGYSTDGTHDHTVENIPPEPRIVERWMGVQHTGGGNYRSVAGWLPADRYEAPDGFRIARVLIEEPGDQ